MMTTRRRPRDVAVSISQICNYAVDDEKKDALQTFHQHLQTSRDVKKVMDASRDYELVDEGDQKDAAGPSVDQTGGRDTMAPVGVAKMMGSSIAFSTASERTITLGSTVEIVWVSDICLELIREHVTRQESTLLDGLGAVRCFD